MKRVHFTASGEVQGVGLRWSVQEMAQSLGLSGWIRNREDGMVEGEVQGTDPKIGEFMKNLKAGPGRARIETLIQEARPIQKLESGFDIRR